MFDGYARISSVKGRSGESFISPDVQRDTIARLARAHAVELDEVVDECDVSGAKRSDDRELGRLIEKVERGESEGIIVWKLTRFSRSMRDALEAVERIVAVGGRLLAEDFDSSGPMAKPMLGLLAGLAEAELDARREGWAEARSRANARGVPNGRVVFGYRKGPDEGRPVIAKAQAAKVREAFQLVDSGVPTAEIARRMGWAHSTTRQRLANPAYIGVATSGAFRNERAYPPIVDGALFERVQARRTPSRAATGELTRERVLAGIARCAGCGRTLKVVHRPRADGSRVSAYFCKNAATEECTERAYVHCDALEEYVCDFFATALRSTPRLVDVVAVGRELESVQRERQVLESQLKAFVEMGDTLRPEDFQHGYAFRTKAIDELVGKERHLSGRLPRLPAGGSLIDLWDGFSSVERREVLRGFLARVVVSRGASSDLSGHVVIEWSDGTVAHDETRIRVAAA